MRSKILVLVLALVAMFVFSFSPVAAAPPPPVEEGVIPPTATPAAPVSDEAPVINEAFMDAFLAKFMEVFGPMMDALKEELVEARAQIADLQAENARLESELAAQALTFASPLPAPVVQVGQPVGPQTFITETLTGEDVLLVEPAQIDAVRAMTVSTHMETISDTDYLVVIAYGVSDGARRLALVGWEYGIDPDTFDQIPPHIEYALPEWGVVSSCDLVDENAGRHVCYLPMADFGGKVWRWSLMSELAGAYVVNYVRNDGASVSELVAYDRFNGGTANTGWLDPKNGEFWPTAGVADPSWEANEDGSFTIAFNEGPRFTHYRPDPLLSYERKTVGPEREGAR